MMDILLPSKNECTKVGDFKWLMWRVPEMCIARKEKTNLQNACDKPHPVIYQTCNKFPKKNYYSTRRQLATIKAEFSYEQTTRTIGTKTTRAIGGQEI